MLNVDISMVHGYNPAKAPVFKALVFKGPVSNALASKALAIQGLGYNGGSGSGYGKRARPERDSGAATRRISGRCMGVRRNNVSWQETS